MKHQPVNDHAADPPHLLAHAAARIAFGVDAREISDFAAALVPTNSDRYANPGEFITQSRQLRKMTAYFVIRSVLLERARGTSWAQVAAAYGEPEAWARATWEPAERMWLADLASKGAVGTQPQTLSEALSLPPSDVPLTDDDIRKVAEQLDQWCASRQATLGLPLDEGPDAPRPVSGGITEQ